MAKSLGLQEQGSAVLMGIVFLLRKESPDLSFIGSVLQNIEMKTEHSFQYSINSEGQQVALCH